MQKEIQKYLLGVAKNMIAEKLGISVEKLERPSGAEILNEKRGVFVTLEIRDFDGRKQLRGCIGNIMPFYALEEGVRQNALNAAFEDPRFRPLTTGEFDDIEIEISVLSVPEKLEYSSAEDLVKKLRPEVDGVIVRKGRSEATYLPQVWEDLKDKELFLNSLCMKAGLNGEEWKSGDVEVETYQAEVF